MSDENYEPFTDNEMLALAKRQFRTITGFSTGQSPAVPAVLVELDTWRNGEIYARARFALSREQAVGLAKTLIEVAKKIDPTD